MDKGLLSIGADPRYWYPVARSASLKRGKTMALSAWDQNIVVYRDANGEVHAIENRCLHRGVALDQGQIDGCDLVCPYHGWVYGCSGHLKSIPYLTAGKRLPQLHLRAYETAERAGIVWIFPSAAARPSSVRLPDTSAVETSDWLPFTLDNDFHNHFAIGIINGMDYFHFHLHNDYQPWRTIEVESVTADADEVHGVYKITSHSALPDRVFNWILGTRGGAPVTRYLKVHFLYPHHLAEVDDHLKVWVFFLPLRPDLVRVFITMYVRRTGISRVFRVPFKKAFSPMILRRIQAQDAFAGTLEQAGWEHHPDAPRCEVNGISVAVEKLIRSKWHESRAAEVGSNGKGAQDAAIVEAQPRLENAVDTCS